MITITKVYGGEHGVYSSRAHGQERREQGGAGDVGDRVKRQSGGRGGTGPGQAWVQVEEENGKEPSAI